MREISSEQPEAILCKRHTHQVLCTNAFARFGPSPSGRSKGFNEAQRGMICLCIASPLVTLRTLGKMSLGISPSQYSDILHRRHNPVVKSKSALNTQFEVDPEDLALLQKITGIIDEKELEDHVTDIQNKANRIHDYPCISMFMFTKFNIKLSPSYEYVISLAKTRKDAIFLDIGCCVGNALRKIVSDGWPVENTIGIDLHKEFWDVGHELFKSTPDSFPAGFIGGDLFDNGILASANVDEPQLDWGTVKLRNLTSLTPLKGQISAIYASNVFHLFGMEKQWELARRLASLLSPNPGSIIFGRHGVMPSEPGESRNCDGKEVFYHSAKSFAEMWEELFKPNTVDIKVQVHNKSEKRFTSAFGEWDMIFFSIVFVGRG